MSYTYTNDTRSELERLERALLDKNPAWPQEKARWIAMKALR